MSTKHRFDYRSNTLIIPVLDGSEGSNEISLDIFRKFLLSRWPSLCLRYKTTAVKVKKNTQFGYDWISIFQLSTELGLPFQEFLQSMGKPLLQVKYHAFDLEDIAQALRSQFSWDLAPEVDERGQILQKASRWQNPYRKEHFYQRWMGVSCFIAIAILHGFTLKEVKQFLDIEPGQVDQNFKFFQETMAPLTQRLLSGLPLGKITDSPVVMRRKAMLTMNALRLLSQLHGREMISLSQF